MMARLTPFLTPRRAGAAVAFAIGLCATAAAAQENCAIQRISLCDGCVVTRRVTVQKDKGCVFRNSIDTQIYGVTVTVRPKNGTYGKSNETLQAYVPRKGYVGPDVFEYVLHYEHFGKRASTTIRNLITVQEGSTY